MSVEAYRDPYGLGQHFEASLALSGAEQILAETARDAFCVGHINEDWRAMQRRRFYEARAQHDRAKAALEELNG